MSEMDTHEDSVEEQDSVVEVDPEAPEADAAEQHASVGGERGTAYEPTPIDADEADSADQHRVVEIDEDDYR
jgi:hypothetical protein